MLALALLQAFPGRRIYVSSRVRRADLDLDFPSLGRAAQTGPLSIVDMTAVGDDLTTASRALESARKLISTDDSSHALRALLLPPEVLEAWSQASPPTPTLVVLDSWDAIVERHVGRASKGDGSLPSREEVERIALAQMAQGPVFLVFVVEHREAGQLEYLVNGIVTMERQTDNDRMERWLRIDKLRGTRIANASYPFSLEGGRFQCIGPMRTDLRPTSAHIDPEPGHVPGQIWPGSADYASFFGWLPIGKVTLIERDTEVPLTAVNRLLIPILTQVLNRQGRIFHVPPPGIHPADLWDLYKGRISKEKFLRQVRILGILPHGESEDLAPAMLPLPSGNVSGYDPRTPEAARFLSENTDPSTPNLTLAWISGLKAINSLVPGTYSAETLPGMALAYLHQSPVHMIWVGPEEDPLTQSLRSMASTRLRLLFREGRVFVQGINPRTPSLVLSEGDDRAPYHLLLVV
jgi:KaiC/GvpD/RAD55 family RecA-like ATPase